MMEAPPIKIFSGNASREIAENIAAHFGQDIGNLEISRFSDGEFQPCFNESIRGYDVFLVQSTYAPADNLLELLLMIDAAKRASANQIIAVIPYFGFARQDRKDKPRVSIASKLIANLITAAGANRVMTMDLHAGQIQGFFDIPVDHLDATAVFIPYLIKLDLENLTLASPDTGGANRARVYAKHLKADIAIIDKHRQRANEVASMQLIGDVEGKNVVLVDDIIDTAGTLCKAAALIKEKGALSVRAACTHAILSGKAYERVENSVLEELVVTDTIPSRKHSDKIKVLSVAKVFSDAIEKLSRHESISSLFIT